MKKLVLLRHGESEWNKLNLFTGWMDVDLSEKGVEEAKLAGQTLKAEGYDFDVCYTSYLKRAIHTLNLTLDEMDRALLPKNESLETTIERVVPFFEETIKKDIMDGKRVVIAAHGNSLRALVKYFDNLSNEEIIGVNIPTATPLVYEFDDDMNVIRHYYLGDQEALKAKMDAVANQGKKKI